MDAVRKQANIDARKVHVESQAEINDIRETSEEEVRNIKEGS